MTENTSARNRFSFSRPGRLAIFGAGLLALGGATGAVVMAETRPSVSMAPITPVAIRSLSSSGIVTIRGRVAEVYGNKFTMEDGTGRALVDTGPEGEGSALVTAGAPVTVQGRFDRGFVRAAFLVGQDRKIVALGPLAERGHGPHGGPHDGPRHGPQDGPRSGPGGPQDGPAPAPGAAPPAPPADGAAPPPPPAA